MANTATAELALVALRIADEFGADGAQLAEEIGISLDALARPDARVDPEQATRLWLLVLQRCGDRGDFALRIAQMLATPRTAHIVGYMARNSATLRQAWSRIAKYARLIESTLDMTLLQGPRTSSFRWSIGTTLAVPGIIYEVGTKALLLSAEDWTGEAIEAVEVRFAHPSSTTASALFSALVVFGAGTTEVVIPDSVLDLPLRNADLWLGDYFEARARTFLDEPFEKASFRFMVQERIRETLNGHPPTVASVSKRLGMSGRTLQRKLSHEGLQFSDLVEEVRRDIALSMLREPHLSVYEIASRLGYQDLQSFRSMFARWTGMTPRDFRAQARAGKLATVRKRAK